MLIVAVLTETLRELAAAPRRPGALNLEIWARYFRGVWSESSRTLVPGFFFGGGGVLL